MNSPTKLELETSKIITKYNKNAQILRKIALKQHLREQHPTENEWIWRKLWYAQHCSKVFNSSPRVDAQGPLIPTAFLTSMTTYKRKLANSVRHEKENALLCKKLQLIYNGKGRIDNKLDPLTKSARFSNKLRKEQACREAIENLNQFERLQKIKPFMSREADSKWYTEQLQHMERKSRYPLYWKTKLFSQTEVETELLSLRHPRPIVYIDIELRDIIVDRIFIELFADICPKTAENFRLLCTNENGEDGYPSCAFTKIWPNVLWRCGGEEIGSAFGQPFNCENFKVKHDTSGIVSMLSYEGSTEAGFMISARPLPTFDGKFVAFGKVVWGLDYMNFLSKACKPYEDGKPRIDVIITAAGQIEASMMSKLVKPRQSQQQKEEFLLTSLLDRLNRGERPRRSKVERHKRTQRRIFRTKSNSRVSKELNDEYLKALEENITEG